MRDLIKIEYLTNAEIEGLMSLAQEYKNGKKSNFSNHHCALMFFENSTRTMFSFECALNKLGAYSYIFDNAKSSILKGEEIFDTINNLCAIGISTFITRTAKEGFIDELKKLEFYKPINFINAGEGKSSHPTQALLDYFTMKEKLKDVKNKKIVIVGDIKHSRVAKSNIKLLSKMGANLVLCAPKYFTEKIDGAEYVPNLDEALLGADVVMCLRIQKERLNEEVSIQDYIKNYQINSANMPKNAILMHPGPVNRDVEISNELINSKYGRTILNQAENGVYVRMAVLDSVFKGDEA